MKRGSFCRELTRGGVALAIAIGAVVPTASFGQSVEFINTSEVADAGVLNQAAQAVYAKARSDSRFKSSQLVKLHGKPHLQDRLALIIDGKTVNFAKVHAEKQGDYWVWGGTDAALTATIDFAVKGDEVGASIQAFGKVYELRFLQKGIAALLEVNQELMKSAMRNADRQVREDHPSAMLTRHQPALASSSDLSAMPSHRPVMSAANFEHKKAAPAPRAIARSSQRML